MEFPGTKLKRPVRLTISLIFILAFFILTPLIIAYTVGYRYDWQSRTLLSLGAINIDIEPEDAYIYIDNKPQKRDMPLRLKDVTPDKYFVKITADGYYDWQKIVEVKSKQTVYIKDISMIKKTSPEIVTAATTTQMSISFTKDYLAYLETTEQEQNIFIMNLKNNQTKKVLTIPQEEELLFTWAPNNNFLAISDIGTPHNTLYLINADDASEQLDLIKKIKYPVEKFQWHDSREPELYYSTELKIISILPGSDERLILTDNIYEDWYMEGDRLWAIERNTTTEKIKIVEDVLGFSKTFADEEMFNDDEQNLDLKIAYDGTLLLQHRGQERVILLHQDKKFNLPGKDFLISDFNDWWLIWTPWEVWSYTRGDEPLLLTRAGQQLESVTPLDKYNTLALNWAEYATALFPYYLVSHELITTPAQDVQADTDERLIYFLAEIDEKKGIWRLEY